MSVINELVENQPYTIQFTANDDALHPADLYVVLTGWVPGDTGAQLPAPTRNQLSPGGVCTIPGTTPPSIDARRLRIDITVPDSGGGVLVVTQGASSQTIPVTGSNFFLSSLVPA